MLIQWMACGVSGQPPQIEALAAGAGYWPANSRTAVEEVIAAELSLIELDVTVTDDHVPVLHDGPWLEIDECTWWNGTLLSQPVWIRPYSNATLSDQFLCGGLPDPNHPNALLVEDSLPSLAEIVALLPATPIDQIRLDVYYEDMVTPPPDVLARNILDVWESIDLPQVLSISSNHPDVLAAFDAEAHIRGRDIALGWVMPSEPEAEEILTQELDRWASGLDYTAMAEIAGADILWIDPSLADPSAVRAARADGVQIGISPIDDARARDYWSKPGRVDRVATSYPGDLGGAP